MIEIIFSLLIAIILLYALYLVINFIVARMGLPSEIRALLFLLLGVIALIWLASLFGIGPGVGLGAPKL